MHPNIKRLSVLNNKVKDIITKKQLKTNPQIIVVTKTFSMEKIIPLIESGHLHYGENKIQEAENKWQDQKKKYNNLKLHMVGKLQTNKVKKALMLFDYIHSLDNEKLALKISQIQKELNKKTKLFIQVNIANEEQKSGIDINLVKSFHTYCTKELSLDVIGLMCLPPLSSDSQKYFKLLKELGKNLNISEFSMGMSSDFEQAILNGSTFLRLGTLIMGERKTI